MNTGFNESEITEFKALLEQLKIDLEAALSSTSSQTATVQLDQTRVGRLSRMDAMQQQQMAKATNQQLRIRLQQVLLAMRAIEQGDYGECRECGAHIKIKRLRVTPEAPFCPGCQRRKER